VLKEKIKTWLLQKTHKKQQHSTDICTKAQSLYIEYSWKSH